MKNNIKITNLKEEKIEEAVEVMLTAFKDEALTSAWLNLGDPNLKSAYSIAVKIIYSIHLDAGDPIYTAQENELIVGLAGLTTPEAQKNKLRAFKMFMRNLPRMLPLILPVLRAVRMLVRIMKPPSNLPKNYCTLEILAVKPGYQGKGIASRLMTHIDSKLLAENNYSGIYLLTGEEKNVNIYEHFGYKIVEKKVAQDVTAYHMFKAKN